MKYLSVAKRMTARELIVMLSDIKSANNPITGQYNRYSKRGEKAWAREKAHFNIDHLEYDDEMIVSESGNVRYVGTTRTKYILDFLCEAYGFTYEE